MKRSRLAALLLAASLLAGCAGSAGGASGSAPQSAGGAGTQEPVALTICLDPDAQAQYGASLRALLAEEFPQVEAQYELLPEDPGYYPRQDGTDETAAKAMQLRTEIMAGQGPDLFLLCADNRLLFPDPDKQMRAGVFLDLGPYMDTIAAGHSLNETVLAAGQADGAQYLLPLTYSVPAVAGDGGALGELPADSLAPADWLEQLLAAAGGDAGQIALLKYMLNRVCAAPVPDYAGQTLAMDDSLAALMALAARPDANEAGAFEAAQQPFFLGSLGAADGLEEQLAERALAGQQPVAAAVPNGAGGVTASVRLYAGVRANSPHGALAAEILNGLLAPQRQTLPEELGRRSRAAMSYSVNDDALLPVAESYCRYRQMLAEAAGGDQAELAAPLAAAAERVNTARFSAVGDELLYYEVLGPHMAGQGTLAEAFEAFAYANRFYFDE